MKESFDLLVVIPVGPGCRIDFIEDTISSIEYYVQSTHKIILADDSQQGTGRLVQHKFTDIDVVPTAAPMGKLCGLYITLSMAFRYALDNFNFKVLLRMDTDALIIGKAPEKEAISFFRSYPTVGMAGQYQFDYNGRPWDISWPAGHLWKILHTRFFFERPWLHWRLWQQYRKARLNNYQRGESVFGGACFFSRQCLERLRAKGLLPRMLFRDLQLEEDHLFSLLVKSAGYELGNLAKDGMPLGCAWRGLPASPHTLEQNGKKIIHSTRFWKQLKEEDIRQWFREKRKPAGVKPIPLPINN